MIEEMDHLYDWERTIRLRAKPAPKAGEGASSWLPFAQGLYGQGALRVNTDIEPKNPKSSLTPRLEDRRFYLFTNHKLRITSNASKDHVRSLQSWQKGDYGLKSPEGEFNTTGPTSPESESESHSYTLPFIPKETLTLRRDRPENCSHSPRFRYEDVDQTMKLECKPQLKMPSAQRVSR